MDNANSLTGIVSRLTMIFLLLLTLLLSSNVTALPAAVPLAVRSPYLNCWFFSTNITSAMGQTWPTTFNRTQTLGWSVLVRIDGLTYSLLGDVVAPNINGTVSLTSSTIRLTSTAFTAQAGPMQVNLIFLNPIEPQDWVKQSIPFSYMYLTANSTDGASHAVQVYSDVSGEWISGDRSQRILWAPTSNKDVVFHSVTLQTQATFKETIDQAEWGTLYYAMLAGKNVTSQISSDAGARGNFTLNGWLNSDIREDPNLPPISDNFTVFAISRDLGTIKATQDPVVWAIGHTTDSAINYSDLSGAPPISRSPYYKIQYANDEELIVDFLNDFSNASSRAEELNSKISQDAESIARALGDLVIPTLYDVFGSMQLTIGTDVHGTPNKSDVMMFMKNIGGSQANRVNAVETLYAAFPALMYINSSLGRPLLEPLFRLQESYNYTIPFAAADLGSNYPSVSGSNSNHSQGVEQTGNMLIMTYAYACASGDGSLISRYYNLLTSWADYLNASTLFIHDQSSADNLTVNNQTNLAIKGIIAIGAMSQMASVMNRTDDVNKYTNATANLYAQWKSLALGSDQHLLAAYGQPNSWTLGYNLFADKWLGTNLVESSIYTGHSNFIYNLVLNSNFSTYGMPADNFATNVAASSWSLFAAAMTSNQGLRTQLIEKVSARAYNFSIPGVSFPVNYDSGTKGTPVQGMASPAQGAVFAPLALNVPDKTITVNGTTTTNLPRNKKVSAIVRGIIGGVATVTIFAMIGIVSFVHRQHRRKQKRNRSRSIKPFSTDSTQAGPGIVTPFNPNFPQAPSTQDTVITAEQQRLITEEPVTPVPVGLSGKELARVRTEALSSQQPDNPRGSTSNVSQSTLSPTAVAETGGAALPYTRELHSEVESLRQEMELLRAEGLGLIIAAPPSYCTEGNG